MIKNLILRILKFYQKFISPNFGRVCRFYPSCSEYGYLALKKYGLAKGLLKSVGRILRCHPFNRGGIDFP